MMGAAGHRGDEEASRLQLLPRAYTYMRLDATDDTTRRMNEIKVRLLNSWHQLSRIAGDN